MIKIELKSKLYYISFDMKCAKYSLNTHYLIIKLLVNKYILQQENMNQSKADSLDVKD